ncbi:MAG: response regulator [Planctomycetota bacterium]
MSNPIVETLRHDSPEVQELLQSAGDCATSPSTKRRHTRWAMQHQKAIVTVKEDNSVTRNLLVVPRNLSTGGVSFLHGGFLHIGTHCVVTLRTLKGQAIPAKGTVTRCVLRKGGVHEIGVRFETQVDPRKFFIDSGDAPLFNAESVDIQEFSGTILLVSSSESERLLLSGHLSAPGITTESAVDKDQALLIIEKSDPDITFIDLSLADPSWFETVAQFRDTGYSGALILLSSRVDAESRMSALCAGVTEVIAKPYETITLHRAVAEYLGGMCGSLLGMRPLVCDLEPGRVERDVIVSYVDELQDHANVAHHALKDGDRDELRKLFTELESSAPQFGFAPISLLCAELLEKLDKQDWSRPTKAKVQQFIKMCRRAEAPIEDESFSDGEDETQSDAA